MNAGILIENQQVELLLRNLLMLIVRETKMISRVSRRYRGIQL